MARANGSKKFSSPAAALNLAPDLVSALNPERAAPAEPSDARELPIADLWLDDQPRQIVPDVVLARLIAEDQAQPAALLAALREVAPENPYYAGVLEKLEELAVSIKSSGVLTPLLVVRIGGRWIVRDGHRRTLASLIADRETVPTKSIAEPSDVEATAQQLVVNLQRENLNALEKARWMLRLARLVENQIRTERGNADGTSVIDVLVHDSDSSEDDGEASAPSWRNLSLAEKDLARQVQERVCELTGLRHSHYYGLMGLNRLSPAAREAGLALTEGQLRPVATLKPEDQAPVVAFIARQGLGRREATTLVKVVRSGDRDAVQRVMAKLAKEDVGRQRASVSWETLMHALPRDLEGRCVALHAELLALDDDRRRVRLQTMHEQRVLARELVRHFDEMLDLFGFPFEEV